MKKLCILFLSSLLLISQLIAGTAGKVSGTVTDETTGEPLIGANVVIQGVGDYLGAATDANGNFVILNVTPGNYVLKATMIGFAAYNVKDVHVEIDLTTIIDVPMRLEVIAGETVEVFAKRKIIKKDVAGSQKTVTSEELESLPVSDIGSVLGMKAGISSDFSIRGSSSSEVMFAVDGISMRDSRTNEPMVAMPLSAMQSMSVQTGGLSAQYSNVRSGVVNVVTKEGGKEHYSGSFTIRYSPAAQKNFGGSPFDENAAWLRPYLDDDVCWTGTNNGAWNSYEQRQYKGFDGWNAFSEKVLSDDNPNNDLTPVEAKRIFEWEHRKEGWVTSPDRTLDFGFGGPVPLVSEHLGNLRFFVSHVNTHSMYPMKLTTEGLKKHSTILKVTSDIDPTTKFSVMAIYGEKNGTTSSRGGLTSLFSGTWGVADATDRRGFTVPWRLFTNTYWCPTSEYSSILSAKLNKILSSTSYFSAQVKVVHKKYHTDKGAYRDTTLSNEIMPGYFVDESPFGFYPEPVSSIVGDIIMGGAVSTSRDESEFTTYEAKFDYTNQINFRHQLKAGLAFHYDNFKMDFGSENVFLPAGNYETIFERNPFRITGYFEDKIEYEGFVTTIGIIPELVVFNDNWYDADTYQKDFYSQDFEDENENDFMTKKVKPAFYLSPRVGISHPITATSKLFFNYGHYQEMPDAQNNYRMRRNSLNKLQYIGDPELPLTRTISYEIGFDQALFNTYLVHLSAYYKSIDNETAWTGYTSMEGKVSYDILTSNHYEDIRGLELELIKNYGDWVTGMLNYEYRVGSSGYFGKSDFFENPSEQSEWDRNHPFRQYFSPSVPRFKANVDFHTPENFGPTIAGQNILGGWHFNLIGTYTGGTPITWNPKKTTGITYNLDRVAYHNVNLKLSKLFVFGKTKIKIFADVYNLMNYKYFSNASFLDSYDYNDYVYSLHLSKKQYEKLGYNGVPGNDKYGEYRKKGVDFQPIEYTNDYTQLTNPNDVAIYYDGSLDDYYQLVNGNWTEVSSKKIDKIIEDKAYIDMPNHTYYTFLSPRDLFAGMTISFDLR